MKVLLINTVCGRGSTGRIATDIWHKLQENGDECRIAYGVGAAKRIPEDNTMQVGDRRDYYVHNVLSRFLDCEGLWSRGATQRLIREIKAYDPDVIHLHNLHGHYLQYQELFEYLKKADKKVVWTLHDCWPFTGHCTYFSAAKCDQWKKGCRQCSQMRQYPQCYLPGQVKKNFALKKAAFTGVKDMQIITPSQWLADLVKQSFLQEYPVRVIHNGIDLNVFKPSESDFRMKYGLQGMTLALGVASDWGPRKGLDDFLALIGKLDNSHAVVMVGLVNEQISVLGTKLPGYEPDDASSGQAVVFKAGENACGAGKVILIPRTDSVEELAQIYSAADVFVNTTYEDNFPTVNLEALACGTPVITYRTGGSVEAVTEDTGMVVPQGDIDALAAAIPAAKALRRDLIARDALRFDAQARYGDYVALFHEMLGGK